MVAAAPAGGVGLPATAAAAFPGASPPHGYTTPGHHGYPIQHDSRRSRFDLLAHHRPAEPQNTPQFRTPESGTAASHGNRRRPRPSRGRRHRKHSRQPARAATSSCQGCDGSGTATAGPWPRREIRSAHRPAQLTSYCSRSSSSTALLAEPGDRAQPPRYRSAGCSGLLRGRGRAFRCPVGGRRTRPGRRGGTGRRKIGCSPVQTADTARSAGSECLLGH